MIRSKGSLDFMNGVAKREKNITRESDLAHVERHLSKHHSPDGY
jgi:hypothetical protein